jgi:hypothetical protein
MRTAHNHDHEWERLPLPERLSVYFIGAGVDLDHFRRLVWRDHHETALRREVDRRNLPFAAKQETLGSMGRVRLHAGGRAGGSWL